MLAVLCVTEIVSWGVLYYAFPALAPTIAADTGWSISATTDAFSTGLVVSALVGIPAGRWLDRCGPRVVMTTGSVLAVPAVLGIATATSLAGFFASWVLAGVAMAGVLYQPAFAALTRWWGSRRVTALTVVTLLAGLASTIFAPLTAALLAGSDWRTTYVVLAVLLASITVPAHLWGLRGPWPDPEPADPLHDDPRAIIRSRPYVMLVLALTLASFAVFAVAGTTALFALAPGPAVVLVGIAVFAGAARGVLTLLQATAISDRWGSRHYGRLSGVLAAPGMAATAVAPMAGAALAEALGGYTPVFALLALVAALAALLIAGTVPSTHPVGADGSVDASDVANASRVR